MLPRTAALLLALLAFWALNAGAADTDFAVKPGKFSPEDWRERQAINYERIWDAIGSLRARVAAKLSLTAEDLEGLAVFNAERSVGEPYKVGRVKPLSVHADFSRVRPWMLGRRAISFANGLLRKTEDGGFTWSIRLTVENSGGMRLRLKDLSLPSGTALYLHNAAGEVRGPYRGEIDSLWTHSIGGRDIALQLVAEDAAMDRRAARLTVDKALLLTPETAALCPDNAACVEDGSCYDASDWANIEALRKAVATINFVDGSDGFLCSGSLLNDTDPDSLIPYFLTANHCISTSTVAATAETRFNFTSSSCGGGCYWPSAPSTIGATLLSTSSDNDHTLLRLNENPPAGATFLGWSTTAIASSGGTTLYRLSHPKGSPQAFSTHAVAPTATTCFEWPRGNFIYSQNQVGAIENGSSGAPALNAQAQVVGQLAGRCGTNLANLCDAVNNATVDGAFANYYPDVAPWLDPDGDPQPVPGPGPGSDPGAGACPATAISNERARPAMWEDLLYQVRDQVLAQSSEGQWMIETYYRHSAEVSERLKADQRLRHLANRLLPLLLPDLLKAVNGNELGLSRWKQSALRRFALALRDGASVDLKNDIDEFTAMNWGHR